MTDSIKLRMTPLTVEAYEDLFGRPLTAIERAVVEGSAAAIERKQSWYRSLQEEFGPTSKRREATLAAMRNGLFDPPVRIAEDEAADLVGEGVQPATLSLMVKRELMRDVFRRLKGSQHDA